MYCQHCGSVNSDSSRFCKNCGKPIGHVYISHPQPGLSQDVSHDLHYGRKNKVVAISLAIFFGPLGLQEFYLGNPLRGILGILFCWTCIPTIIAIIQIFRILSMNDAEFQVFAN